MGVSNPVGSTGGATVKKIGHTVSGVFGVEPDAKVKGRPTEPTPISYGK